MCARPSRFSLNPVDLPGFVPVYTALPGSYNGRVSITQSDWLPHSKIGCYAIQGEMQVDGYKFYRIQWKDNQEAWIPYKRKHFPFRQNIEAVHVEDASIPTRASRTVVHTEKRNIGVYLFPAYGGGGNNLVGQLDISQGYDITGTYLDLRGPQYSIQVEADLTRRRWWQIDLSRNPRFNEDVGWVRSDWVNECGPTGDIALGWPQAPRDLQAEIQGSAVKVSWVADPALGDAPAHLGITGYRIWRYEQGTGIFAGINRTITLDRSDQALESGNGRIIWRDYPQTPLEEAGIYYQVAALGNTTEGQRTALVSASTAPTRPMVPPPPITPNPPNTPPAPPPPGTPTPTPAATAVSVTLEATQGSSLAVKTGPGRTATVAGFTLRRGRGNARDVVGYFHHLVGRARQEWLQLRQARSGVGGASEAAVPYLHGWVPLTAVEGRRDWDSQVRRLPQPPFVRARDTRSVPVRVGPSLGYTEYLTQIDSGDGWYAVVGRNDDWWQIRLDATRKGWVPDSQVLKTGDRSAVPVVNEAPPPALAGPGGSDPAAAETGQASGHYLNLANSWQGSWRVSKTSTKVTAAFQSSRSPVQYLARQNPMDLLVLPEGFRPTATKDIAVTGVHVTINGVNYDGDPRQAFKLRVSTTGRVRYVDGPELDHVGFLRYEVGTPTSGTTITWTTATAATPGARPALSDLSGSGTYHNQQVNWGSSWKLKRKGDDVSGSFTTTRSPVEYFANRNREAQVWLPAEYWPNRDARFQVKGAVRVNQDGTTSTDRRKVNFWLTVRSRDGRMYYDRDPSLQTQGVGYLRYSVNVDWDASPRVQVPSAPRELEVDEVAATEVELDWRSPADNGGDSVDEYKVEIYRKGRWRLAEDDISRTRYEVEDLDAYTRYSFRVAARNSAGWGPFSTAVSVTTRRAKPGQPRSLAAVAGHDRVTLDWRAPSSGGGVTGYRVERRIGRGSYAVVAADTGSAVSFHMDQDVQPATGYSYRVRALNHGEEGDWLSARSVTTAAAPTIPGTPTALTVSPGPASQLQLSWTPPGDTGGGVTGYQVERSPDTTTRAWKVIQTDTGSADTTWDEGEALVGGTVYHYRVSACNSAGVGPASNEASGHTRPRLRLDRPVQYPLTVRAEPRAEAEATATFANFLPERIFDLTAATDGWQRILSFHAARSDALWVPMAAGSVQGVPEDLAQVPGAPAGFTATLAANNEVTLAWRVPAIGGAVTGYRLWRQFDDGAFSQLGTDQAATATTYTDNTVRVNHAYRYWLQAISAEGAGIPSEAVALAVMNVAAAPASVRNLVANPTATTLQLSWQKAATGGLPAEYRVEWQGPAAAEAETVTVVGTTHVLTDLRPNTSYTLKVTACNQEGEATVVGRTVSTRNVPGTPTALAVAVAGNGVTATWEEPVDGGYATRYEVQGKARTATWPTTATARTVLSHALTNLTFAGDYDLRVRAVNTEGHSAWVAVPFTAGPERPGAVRNLVATPGPDSRMQLTWQAPADHSVVTGYRIERAVEAVPLVWTEVASDTGNTHTVWTDSDLTAATVYHYRVTGRSAAGLGTASAAVDSRTRPQAALKATASYPLKAYTDPQTTAPATHAWTVHDDTVKLDVAGRAGGTAGWYRVLRFGESADGPYWLPAGAVTVTGATTDVPEAPGMPTALAATATHNRVTLTWKAPATGGAVTGFRIWRQTGTGAFTLLETDPESTATTYTDLDRDAATTHAYRVQALSAAGAGPRTAAVSVTTAATPVAPGAPTGLTAVPGADSQLQLNWTVPSAAGTHAIAGYLVERSPDVDPRIWFALSEYVNTTDLIWADRALEADTVYHYRVRAVSAAGGGEPSDGTEARTRPQLALKVDAGYPLQARAWPATEAPVTRTWTAHDAAVQLDVSGQASGSNGWWRVLHFGEADRGPYWLPAAAATVTGMTTDVPEAPGLPGTFKSTTTTHNSVTLTWSAPGTGGTVTGYRLWRQTGTGTLAVVGDDLAADALTYTDTGLTAATDYRYRMQALSAAGAGPRTGATAVMTLAGTQIPAIPTDLGAAPSADSQMLLSWTAPTSGAVVTGYRVERSLDVVPLDWTEVAAGTGNTDTTWSDRGLAAATVYHYRVTARSGTELGAPSTAAEGRTRPQATLSATIAYPLTAHRWPSATAPVSHTWATRDAAVLLDVAGQGAGSGWFRLLRFGHRASGPYWLPAAAVSVTGATADLPQAPGAPGNPTAIASADTVTLTWTAPSSGGTVTGYRLWRQAGTAAWTVLTDTLAADAHTHTDTGLAANTAYRYRLQARSAAGHGPRTAVLTPAAAGPAPAPPVLTLYAQPGSATLIVRGADGTVRQALAWSGPLSGDTTLTGRSGYHRLVVPAGRTLTVRARSQDGAGRWSSWTTRTLATR